MAGNYIGEGKAASWSDPNYKGVLADVWAQCITPEQKRFWGMMRLVSVRELRPGDLVTMALRSAVFITREDHPKYPGLQMVVWRLDDGSISADALSLNQEVGEVVQDSLAERMDRLLRAVGE